ncbi:hypothetical protein ACHQM5_009175 [Ranunculus cassubicifolius]
MENLVFQTPLEQVSNLALYDLVNECSFNHYIDLLRGESGDPNLNFPPYYDEHMFNGDLFGLSPPLEDDVCNLHSSTNCTSERNCILNSLPSISGDIEIDEDDSSEYTTEPRKTTSSKGDRSKTLVSERRRRSSMKEKLYALRSLVPNITKMDKASIVGDAVSYVQELQMQAKKIKAEIAGLEASLTATRNFPYIIVPKNPTPKKMLQMDVYHVEGKEYYVRVVCNKSEGVVVALHKALESLSYFDIKSSNFTTGSEKFVLTFTVDVGERNEEMNAPILTLWVTKALLNQGFEIKTL